MPSSSPRANEQARDCSRAKCTSSWSLSSQKMCSSGESHQLLCKYAVSGLQHGAGSLHARSAEDDIHFPYCPELLNQPQVCFEGEVLARLPCGGGVSNHTEMVEFRQTWALDKLAPYASSESRINAVKVRVVFGPQVGNSVQGVCWSCRIICTKLCVYLCFSLSNTCFC